MTRPAARPRPWSLVVLSLGVFALLAALAVSLLRSGPAAGRPPGPPRVVVSVPAVAWPVRELAEAADAGVDVGVIVPVGSTPHGFELTMEHLRAIIDADLVVAVGFGLDQPVFRAVERRPDPGRAFVDLRTAAESRDLTIRAPGAGAPAEPRRADGDESGVPLDPHAWLDPFAMAALIEQVAEVFVEPSGAVGSLLTPEARARVSERAERLVAETAMIDAEYARALGTVQRRTLVVHHLAYGYLCARYELEMVAAIRPVETAEPTAGDLASVIDAIRSHDARAIFVEPQFSRAAAERIAQRGGLRVLELDPLGDGDWPAMMRANLATLVDGLGGDPGALGRRTPVAGASSIGP